MRCWQDHTAPQDSGNLSSATEVDVSKEAAAAVAVEFVIIKNVQGLTFGAVYPMCVTLCEPAGHFRDQC